MLIVTTDSLPGYEIRAVLGEVFGVAVQTEQARGSAPGAATSPSSGTFRMTGETAVGLAQTRRDALARLGEEARRMGATAVIGMGFDNALVGGGGHEVCAYGTAVQAEPVAGGAAADRSAAYQKPAAASPGQPSSTPGQPPMVARNLTIGLRGDRPR